MEPGALLGQAAADFSALVAGDFSDSATITDGETTIVRRGLFYEASQDVDPDTQATVITPDYKFQISEMGLGFKVRRKGLLVTIRGRFFKVREWIFDGLGGLTLYLDEQKGEASPSVDVQVSGARTEYFSEADIVDGSIRPRDIPLAGSIHVYSRGQRLVEGTHWLDNHDGSLTLEPEWLPVGGDVVTVDYQIF